MAKTHLQDYIKTYGGYTVSEATLLTSDLLVASLSVIEGYDLKPKFRKELTKIVELYTPDEVNYPEDEDFADTLSWLLNEDIFNYFNDVAPKGYYYGTSEGDGACFGFWKYEEEDE